MRILEEGGYKEDPQKGRKVYKVVYPTPDKPVPLSLSLRRTCPPPVRLNSAPLRKSDARYRKRGKRKAGYRSHSDDLLSNLLGKLEMDRGNAK